ncbi:MAG: hypothetical protein QOH08_950 [Chloroflexota bacterium]|nr:hypothetical protein [Chloroflexota bacterium]
MDRRSLFVAAAGTVLAIGLVLFVIRPGLERGGTGEILVIAGIFVAILLFERYLRSR